MISLRPNPMGSCKEQIFIFIIPFGYNPYGQLRKLSNLNGPPIFELTRVSGQLYKSHQ